MGPHSCKSLTMLQLIIATTCMLHTHKEGWDAICYMQQVGLSCCCHPSQVHNTLRQQQLVHVVRRVLKACEKDRKGRAGREGVQLICLVALANTYCRSGCEQDRDTRAALQVLRQHDAAATLARLLGEACNDGWAQDAGRK